MAVGVKAAVSQENSDMKQERPEEEETP